jgi:hypothetical protein
VACCSRGKISSPTSASRDRTAGSPDERAEQPGAAGPADAGSDRIEKGDGERADFQREGFARVLRKRAAHLGYRVRPFGGVDVAVGVDGHALARRALIHPVVAFERRDEPGDAVLVDRADPDAVTPDGPDSESIT